MACALLSACLVFARNEIEVVCARQSSRASSEVQWCSPVPIVGGPTLDLLHTRPSDKISAPYLSERLMCTGMWERLMCTGMWDFASR